MLNQASLKNKELNLPSLMQGKFKASNTRHLNKQVYNTKQLTKQTSNTKHLTKQHQQNPLLYKNAQLSIS